MLTASLPLSYAGVSTPGGVLATALDIAQYVKQQDGADGEDAIPAADLLAVVCISEAPCIPVLPSGSVAFRTGSVCM